MEIERRRRGRRDEGGQREGMGMGKRKRRGEKREGKKERREAGRRETQRRGGVGGRGGMGEKERQLVAALNAC